MIWKKKRLENYRLQVIVNRPFFKNIPELADAAAKAASAGNVVIQLRDKVSDKKTVLEEAQVLRKRLAGTKSVFIVNDHADIARIAGADGVHLGQSDLPLPAARQLLGRNRIIGISCVNLDQALEAQRSGADYLGIGAVFSTGTKPESAPLGVGFTASVCAKIKIPVFAIGGITELNLRELISSGCRRVAVSSAVCCAADPAISAGKFCEILNSYDTVRAS